MSRKREPIFTRDLLIVSMEKALLTRGPLSYFTQHKLGPDEKNYLDRNKEKLLFRYTGVDNVVWFGEEKISAKSDKNASVKHTLYQHTRGLGRESVENIRKDIEDRFKDLDNEKRKKLDKMFNKPKVEFSSVDFRSEHHEGILVKAEVKELPLGKQRHLSDNLFIYYYNVILLPVHRFLLKIPPLTSKDWYRFGHREDFVE